ncbi:MAG: ion channel, partial [Pseudomonadota bacterium]
QLISKQAFRAMINQVLIGAAVMFSCVVIQSAMVATAFASLRRRRAAVAQPRSILRASLIVGVMTLWLMLVHAISVAAWALTFSVLGVFSDWDTAVYFAAVSFTTLGFGDIIPPREWRQLAGLCAAHGLLVFGVSSAALVEVFRQTFEGRRQ